MKYIIGIDIGTTSISIAAINESREVIDSITANHDAFIPGDFPESRVQSPERIFEIVIIYLKLLIKKYGQPLAIGMTGQMHGILYVNSQGQSISPLYTWQDSSGNIRINGKSSIEILHENGLKCSSGYGISTHFYLQRSGKIPYDAVKITTISDYIAMKICGNDAPILSSEMAAGLGCFDVMRREFMSDALKSAGVDVSFLPKNVKGYSIVGHTEAGVPVVCSMGDNQASFMGSVDKPENTLLLNIGTGSQISFMTSVYVESNSDIELRPYGNAYILAGSALCGGRAYAMLEEFYREISGHSCYDLMSRHAEDFLNSHDISQAWDVDTRFQGTRSDPSITGNIRGITADNFCPGAFTVGVICGIIGELHGMYKKISLLTSRRADFIVGSGNALRRNKSMQRIAKKIFGIEVRLSDNGEEAARGAAICAANVTGS